MPWNLLNTTGTFSLSPHIYVRNGDLFLKTTKKSNASLPSIFSLAQSIHSAPFCPLPNTFVRVVYAHWLHFPFLLAIRSKTAFSKPTRQCSRQLPCTHFYYPVTWAAATFDTTDGSILLTTSFFYLLGFYLLSLLNIPF